MANALKDPIFKDGFTIGSVEPDGYSIMFILTEKNQIIDKEIEQRGAAEYIQKLVDAVNMTIENNLSNDFINLSKRLIKLIETNKQKIKNYQNYQITKEVINNNLEIYTPAERQIISQRI